nr:ensconsin-like [Oncorhynchus nerka]
MERGVSDSQTKAEERRWSGQTQSSTPTVTLSPTPSNNAANKPEPLVLKIDERQRLARERREEREKQTAAREAVWQEREERARHYYDKHLEERKRKMEEQRRKEDRRRSAVEEKRRHNLEEEKARHEAVMRRTVERSQRAKHTPNRWSWGGALPGNTPTTPGGFVESSFLYPLDLAGLEHHLQGAFSVYRRYGLSHQYADRRSVSTMNLSKHAADPVITKRLSYSSATLLHSPDRVLQKRTSSSPLLNKSQSKLRLPGGKTAHYKPQGGSGKNREFLLCNHPHSHLSHHRLETDLFKLQYNFIVIYLLLFKLIYLRDGNFSIIFQSLKSVIPTLY